MTLFSASVGLRSANELQEALHHSVRIVHALVVSVVLYNVDAVRLEEAISLLVVRPAPEMHGPSIDLEKPPLAVHANKEVWLEGVSAGSSIETCRAVRQEQHASPVERICDLDFWERSEAKILPDVEVTRAIPTTPGNYGLVGHRLPVNEITEFLSPRTGRRGYPSDGTDRIDFSDRRRDGADGAFDRVSAVILIVVECIEHSSTAVNADVVLPIHKLLERQRGIDQEVGSLTVTSFDEKDDSAGDHVVGEFIRIDYPHACTS